MAKCVKVKMNEKVMMLRSSTLRVGNLAVIFELDINQGIYICCEEGREIVIPTETGFFSIEDYAKTYVVNGEPTQKSGCTFLEPEENLGRCKVCVLDIWPGDGFRFVLKEAVL